MTILPTAATSKGEEVLTDSAKVDTIPVLFEDEALETIMKTVADRYGVKVTFRTKEVAALHLYYRFNPALPLEKIVSQLNTFERINITRKENALIIE